MDCQHVAERLSAFLDAELSEQESELVRQHLGTCARCEADCESLSRAWDALSVLPNVRPRADLWPRLDARLSERAGWTAAWSGPARHRAYVQAAAAVVAGLLLGGWLGERAIGASSTAPPAQTAVMPERLDVLPLADVFPGSLAEAVLSAPAARETVQPATVTQ